MKIRIKSLIFGLMLAACSMPVLAMEHPDILGLQLLEAAGTGDLEKVATLLDRGVSVNYADMLVGHTALMSAACEGDLQIIQLLLDRGASVTMVDNDSHTALMFAEAFEHEPCCHLLIEQLMKIPNDMQQKKIYLLLLHMRRLGFGRDIYYIMKPHLVRMIYEENKENPQNSIALQEIRKCTNIGLVWPSKTKQDLLAAYGPKNQWSCTIL